VRVLEKSLAERRRKKLLGALVGSYISTGSPVPSSRVLARSRLSISPATVRSVMAQLDKLGFTTQPHTSAGRIPTQKGFRSFVESLVIDDGPARDFWANVESEDEDFRDAQSTVAGLLEKCCASLSEASGEAGVVLSPDFVNDMIREIRLVEVGPNRIVAVAISDLGIISSSTINVARKLGYFNLKRVEQVLNAKLSGSDVTALFSEDYLDEREKATVDNLHNEVVLKYLINGGGNGKRRLSLEGFSRIFEKREMQTPSAARTAVRFFEDKSRLIEVLTSCQRRDAVSVLLGDEVRPGGDDSVEFGLVAAPYKLNAVPAGALGVIGSMRMQYSKIIPLVEQAAAFVGARLSGMLGQARIAFDAGGPFKVMLRTRG
jgi:heat-inducible transcriptional repressor